MGLSPQRRRLRVRHEQEGEAAGGPQQRQHQERGPGDDRDDLRPRPSLPPPLGRLHIRNGALEVAQDHDPPLRSTERLLQTSETSSGADDGFTVQFCSR